MRTAWAVVGSVLVACGAPSDPLVADRVGPDCEAGEFYPEDPVEPMTLGEVLPAYRWPVARRLQSGEEVPLDLAQVPCAGSSEIDWSAHELLLFVSVPAWCPACVTHVERVAEVEQEIVEAGAEIVWVLQEDRQFNPGTAARCDATISALGGEEGWCVGDAETEPEPSVFADSPFAIGRGFDMIVSRRSLQILWTTTHGTPSGNENPSAEEVLEAVREAARAVDG